MSQRSLQHYCRLHDLTETYVFERYQTGRYVRRDGRGVLRSKVWQSMREDGWTYYDIALASRCAHSSVIESAHKNGWWVPDPQHLNQKQRHRDEPVIPGLDET